MRRALLSLFSILAVAGAQAGTASAQEVASLSIKPTGKLVESGAAARVRLRGSCEPPYQTLEANLSVSQGSFISGFVEFAGFRCDGRVHKARVTVPADEGTAFHKGSAFASAFLLVEHPVTQDTQQAQATRTIRLR